MPFLIKNFTCRFQQSSREISKRKKNSFYSQSKSVQIELFKEFDMFTTRNLSYSIYHVVFQGVMSTLTSFLSFFLSLKLFGDIFPRLRAFICRLGKEIENVMWKSEIRCMFAVRIIKIYTVHVDMRDNNMARMPNHPRLCQIRLSLISLYFSFLGFSALFLFTNTHILLNLPLWHYSLFKERR